MDRGFFICAFIAAGLSATASAQQYDSTSSRVIAPGVTYKRLVVNSGPWRVNLLEIDLTQPGLSLRGVKAKDSFLGRETPSSMVARYTGPGKAVAAVNTDFFVVKTGETENNVIIEGKMSKGVTVSDSPFDTFNNLHTELGIDWGNHAWLERYGLKGRVAQASHSLPLAGFNFRPPQKNYVALYSPFVGDSSPADTLHHDVAYLPLKVISQNGNTLTYRAAGAVTEGSRGPLASGGLLVAEGEMRDSLRAMAKRGGSIRVTMSLSPDHGNLRTVVGGWPRIVRNGRSVAEWADAEEGTFPRFSVTRHPRTAGGMSRDGKTLYLMTVDGRRESDGGMSLVELAHFMIGVGAWDAMNFDGGGSTAMVVEGKVVNHPSDTTGERAVGSALLVVVGDDRTARH